MARKMWSLCCSRGGEGHGLCWKEFPSPVDLIYPNQAPYQGLQRYCFSNQAPNRVSVLLTIIYTTAFDCATSLGHIDR